MFVFLVCGCSGVGDGARLVEHGDKKHVVKKLSKNLLLLFSLLFKNLKMGNLGVCSDNRMNAHNQYF